MFIWYTEVLVYHICDLKSSEKRIEMRLFYANWERAEGCQCIEKHESET